MSDAPPFIIDEDAVIDGAFFGVRTLAEPAMPVPTAAAGFWSCARLSLSASRR